MRLLFLGDIVGAPGTDFVCRSLPEVREKLGIDLVVANAENSTHGSGMNPSAFKQLRAAGVDGFTLGDHLYRRSEIIPHMKAEGSPIVRPANLPPDAPGRSWAELKSPAGSLFMTSVLGRTFMKPVDCPLLALDRVFSELPERAGRLVFVDVHAEATADKYFIAHYLKGRAAAVAGTHTHIPTADEHVTADGMGFICDAGMCGPHDGVLGRRADRVLAFHLTAVPNPFDVCEGDVRMNGVVFELDPEMGRCTSIERFRLRAGESP